MRATYVALIVAWIAPGSPATEHRDRSPAPPAGDDYVAIVHAYRSGDADAAVERFARLNRLQIRVGSIAFEDAITRDDAGSAMPSDQPIEAAAALHTEVAFRSRVASEKEMLALHLDMAMAIVDTGVPVVGRTNDRTPSTEAFVHRVTPAFRRLWYLTVITGVQRLGRIDMADAYLAKARVLFPADADVLLLAGMSEEAHASPRIDAVTPSDRRAALERAEGHLRASLAAAPGEMETRLRLGRVLQQRGQTAEARGMLLGAEATDDPRQSYLASLFLGNLEDAAGNPAAAARWYDKAAIRFPSAQVARIAASELRYRAGDRRQAADDLRAAIGAENSDDPWWRYFFGQPWKVDALLDALRVRGRS
jgi:tetratricopeptide (TPR) repeat protein